MSAYGPVRARAATLVDLDFVASMAHRCHEQIADSRDGQQWRAIDLPKAPITERIRLRIENGIVLIGEIKEVAVGIAVARVDLLQHREAVEPRQNSDHRATSDGPQHLAIQRSATQGQPKVVVIEELFTIAEARGIGVGAAMISLVTSRALDVGATGIQSTALPGDRATKNFFEGQGLKARAITVYRPIT